MKTEIIPGCSSFNESNWKGIFYPENLPRKDWFTFYCKHFNTYEMNGTFYKFPTDKTLANWYNKAPENFVFSVKMYKGITHFKKFKDCQQEIADFYNVCFENLKEKLGYILFQLPPSFSYSEEKLAMLLNGLDYSFKNAIEFRNASWWRSEVIEALKTKGVIFCNVSYPNLPEELITTTQTGYIRLHGTLKLFYSLYGKEYLQKLYNEIPAMKWKEVFVYFNNTASENGIIDALDFKNLITPKTKNL